MCKLNGRSVFILWVAGSLALVSGYSQGQTTSGPPASLPETTMEHRTATTPADAGPLHISYGGQSAEWTPDSLAGLRHTTVTVYNEHAKENQTYSGVLLNVLLQKLGVPEKPHGKDFRLYLLAEGSDGYGVVYSLGEITPDVRDTTVIVADSLAGKPLAQSGPLQLVATGEKRPARWVRNLVSIRVLNAQ